MSGLGRDLSSHASAAELKTRLYAAMWGVGLAIVLLLCRLYTLQVMRGEELTSKGRRNFVQQTQVPHDRGIIYDRYGRILVDNRPSLNLLVTPAFLGKRATARNTLQHLAELLNMPQEELTRVIEAVESRSKLERFRPVVARRDLDPEQIEAIEQERSVFLLDGVDVVEGRRRTYHFGGLAAHLLGYVNEIDSHALGQERLRGNPNHYDLGDIIGREGIEKTLEKELRGTDGTEKIIVDAKGRRQAMPYVDLLMGENRRVAPTPGHNVFLTLDLDLQERAEAAFLSRGRAGSVIALDPKTGAILVLASLPAYDPNLVSGSVSKQVKDSLDQDPLSPWLNRSIAGQYAPGSTFKPVTALAALAQKATTAYERVGCPGYYKMGRHVWRCWRERGHGPMSLHDAMKVSCDAYFYTMGGRIGINAIADVARLLSFGHRTEVDLRGEQPGLVPDEAFHNRVDAATGGYQRGMAINTSIGQGSLLVTPLQMAVAYAAIANGKEVFVPQLVDRTETADFRVTRRFIANSSTVTDAPSAVPKLLARPGNNVPLAVQTEIFGDGPTQTYAFSSRAADKLTLNQEHLREVRVGLQAATGEPGGTGYWQRSRKVSMAGKTGTAQVVRLGRERLKDWQVDYAERDHAWFVAYAPHTDPEIVVVVLNEHAGHGGSAAAPIAVSVIDAFFELKATRLAAGITSGAATGPSAGKSPS